VGKNRLLGHFEGVLLWVTREELVCSSLMEEIAWRWLVLLDLGLMQLEMLHLELKI
jgi:hypothetical protein